jgi:hypothetical protein
MPEHDERPPSALAHGPAKSSDIERVRQDVVRAEKRLANDEKAVAALRWRRLLRREAQRDPDARDRSR